jgi:hypothetical protein
MHNLGTHSIFDAPSQLEPSKISVRPPKNLTTNIVHPKKHKNNPLPTAVIETSITVAINANAAVAVAIATITVIVAVDG